MSLLNHPLVQAPRLVLKLPGYILRRPPLLVALVLILILVGAYGLGYRVGPGLTLMKIGTVVLTDLPIGASVYVNQAFHKTATESLMRVSLLPGAQNFLIGTEDYYPWNELVTVPSGSDIAVKPIFIAKSAKETMLHDLDRERGELLLSQMELPTKESPLKVAGGCVAISMQGSQLIAEATTTEGCTPPPYMCSDGTCEPVLLFTPHEALRAVIPFPGRDDTVIITLGKTIYALEVDPREPRFFAPILREHLPNIAPWSENAIVIEEAGAVFTVTFP
jgi:hypothetical protein